MSNQTPTNNSDKLDKMLATIRQFTQDRDWGKYHTPKNLSLKLMEEVGELVEHFEWKTDEEIKAYLKDEKNLHEVANEGVDILFILLTLFEYCLEEDIEKAFYRKLKKNCAKYPVKNKKKPSPKIK